MNDWPTVTSGDDVSPVLESSRSYLVTAGFAELAQSLPETASPESRDTAEQGIAAGLTFGFVFPGAGAQTEQLPQLLTLAESPEPALGERDQYQAPYAPSDDDLAAAEIHNRPERAYLLLISPEGYPAETRGKTAPQLRKYLKSTDRTSLSAPEYLILQRLFAGLYGDHRFDNYGSGVEDSQWMWLPDSTCGDKTFMAYWNGGKSRVELALCRTGSKNPRKGAHPTLVVPV